MKIFFDLDGTLLDSRPRLYELFQYLVSVSNLSFEEYWNYKRNKINHGTILKERFSYSKEQVAAFEEEWMKRIELAEWLAFDKPYPGVSEFLLQIQQRHTLYVVTARQFESMAFRQIEQYNWTHFFEAIIVTGGKSDKYNLLKGIVEVDKGDWVVGDTGKDIETGKLLGINTAAVSSGFLSREKLAEYSPDIIVESVPDLHF